MPSQTFSEAAFTAVSRDEAWRALQAADTWGRIAGVDWVSDAAHDEGGNLLGFAFGVSAAGRTHQGEAAVAASQPPSRMRLSIESRDIQGWIDVGLSSRDGGTELVVELLASSKGFLAGVAFPMIAGAIGANLGGRVEALARELEG